MLTLEQIIDLHDKGFTYEQIGIINSMDMSTPEKAPTPEPEKQTEQNNAPTPTPEPEKQTEQNNAPAPAQEPENDRVKALEVEIGKLTDTIKAMQSANVKNAQSDPPKIETVDDIIKSFMQAS